MKKGLIYKALRVVVVLALTAVVAGLLIKLRPKVEPLVPIKKGILVEASPVKAQKTRMIVETYGTVKPREVVNLVAETGGQIINTDPSFQEGRFVEKGTVLVMIDSRSHRLNVESRKVQIKQAKAELRRLHQEVRNLEASIKISESNAALSLSEFTRLKNLTDQNVVTRTIRDRAEKGYIGSLERLQGLKNQMALTGPLKEQVDAQLDMAKVLLRQAELDLDKTRIVAPFNGRFLEKVIQKGQHVNAGQYLGKIYSAGALDIEVRVPIKELEWFPTNLNENNMPVAEISFGGDDNSRTRRGRVTRIMDQVDERTRTLPIVVEVNETDPKGTHHDTGLLKPGDLRPGMFVAVRIQGKEIKQAFVLPRHVVYNGDEVYVVDNNRLRIRKVNVIRRFKDSIFIDKGLSDGDLVISSPLSGQSDGTLVRLKD